MRLECYLLLNRGPVSRYLAAPQILATPQEHEPAQDGSASAHGHVLA